MRAQYKYFQIIAEMTSVIHLIWLDEHQTIQAGRTNMIWIVWIIGTLIIYWQSIHWLKKKRLSQQIYEDSPDAHQIKIGTPTMGGVIIFLSFFVGVGIAGQWNLPVIWVLMTTFLFWLIGLIDDGLSLIKKNNKGLSAAKKFGLQILFSIISVGILSYAVLPIEWWQIGLYIFILTGTSNATNLTDGLDGLLSSTMLVSLVGVFLLFQSKWMYEEQTMTLIMMVAIGCFLIFNWYPAKLFMGDVGSLMLGAFLASSVIITGQWPMLIGLVAIYVIETLSVMIQVFWYKLFKRRIFLMTPLHHHFELGSNEVTIVGLFVLIQSGFIWVQLQ